MSALIVIAKRPRPGRVKTRLVPPLTHAQAAAIAAAALRDTLRAADATGADDRVLAFDGPLTGWLGVGWRSVRQPVGGLDERLAAAFEAVSGPAVLVGMDTPQLQPHHLSAFDPQHYDACLGMSTDGGYWAIGFADPRTAGLAIRSVPMSTSDTGAAQLRRLIGLGLRVQALDVLTDVDTIDTAHQVAAQAPQTEFAAVFRQANRRAS